MRDIGMIGAGYVGLVTGTCFAEMGHRVFVMDNNEEKIRVLKSGGVPIYEPGLEGMIKRNVEAGRLFFTSSLQEVVDNCEVIFIAVGTPPRDNGEADLSAVERVSAGIAKMMKGYKLIVEKSTVPVQTGKWIKRTVSMFNRNNVPFDVASNPEFLREGSAISDFLKPDRVVIGVETERASKILREIYEPLGAPIVETDIESAEIIKHASNSFLAMKISFVNALSVICERAGADIKKVTEGMGYDPRIGKLFLEAGVGFGGFCFPKDLRAFIRIAEKLGYDFGLLREVERINEEQKMRFVAKVREALWNVGGKKIAVWGLSFKPNTDDMRFAPSIDIINALLKEGAEIHAYDPIAMDNARRVFGDTIVYGEDKYSVLEGAYALCLITEWDEFKDVDLDRVMELMETPIVIDGRNVFDPAVMKDKGFYYVGVGRR